MGQSWIRLDVDLADHPKTIRLGKLLGNVAHPHVYPINLWCWCKTYQPDGDLSRYADEPEMISHASRWCGEAPEFIEAMVTAGFLDRDGDLLAVHGWDERNGEEFLTAYGATRRQRQKRFKDKKIDELTAELETLRGMANCDSVTKESDTVTTESRDVTLMSQDVTLQDGTRQDGTRQDTEDAGKPAPPTSKKPRKADKAGIDAYCTATGFDAWYALYGARKPGTKRQAQWAWVKLPKKLAGQMFDLTVEYLRLRDEAGEDDTYLFAPHNFLNVTDEHWTDQPTKRGGGNGKARPQKQIDIDYWEQNLGRAPQSFRDDLKARDPVKYEALMGQWEAWVATQQELAKVTTGRPPEQGEEGDDVPF
jgi:hypothetical protein